jgi:hypothetical protein
MSLLDMAKKKARYVEKVLTSFAAGTLDRIDAFLSPNENRIDLIRTAVDRELERRSRQRDRGSNE